jgi:membrane fusion protein (multidrug efflux system)
MNQIGIKARLLRMVWGIIPWLMVALLVGMIFVINDLIKEKSDELEKTKQAAGAKKISAVKVITLTLVPRKLEDKINLPGYIEPNENLWIKAEVPGQVVRVLVKEGAIAKKGQILVELDQRDYMSRLSRIEANYQLAKLEYDRISTLDKKKITAANRLDEIEARLKDVTAQRDEARLALSRTRITAPIGGVINDIQAKLGSFIGVGDPVVQLLQTSSVKVAVGIPESDVTSFFDLEEAPVVITALDQRQVTGKKVFLSRQPRTLARLFDLELSMPNPDGHILPGMFARVELVKKVYPNALIIPLYAVISQGDERFVYIEEYGLAKKRTVELGILVGWQVQVVSGLKAADKVIVVGHRFLNEDQSLEVIKNVTDAQEIIKL